MYGNHFYNETTRRYVAMFGTLFNDIIIERKDNNGTSIQKLKVPINYAPYQKILARLDQDPNLQAPAMTLPRLSFEIMGMQYAPTRKLPRLNKISAVNDPEGLLAYRYNPVPYDIEFQLNVMTKYNEDGTKILEQIIPYFQPDVTHAVKLIDDVDITLDVPIILNSVTVEDTYEGDFETRRALIWTLNFTMKGWFFGPVSDKKLIKFTTVNAVNATVTEQSEEGSVLNAQPGLTANGAPTNTANNSVAYTDIDLGDNWDYIVDIGDI